jgi:hypothetical protein
VLLPFMPTWILGLTATVFTVFDNPFHGAI